MFDYPGLGQFGVKPSENNSGYGAGFGSGYDPTNMDDPRHPFHALGEGFRAAEAKRRQSAVPQMLSTPLANQLLATSSGGARYGAQSQGYGGSNMPDLSGLGASLGKGISSLFGDWGSPGADMKLADLKADYLSSAMPPTQGGLY